MRTIKVDQEEYFRLEGCTIMKAKGDNLYKIVPIRKEENIEKNYTNILKDLFNFLLNANTE